MLRILVIVLVNLFISQVVIAQTDTVVIGIFRDKHFEGFEVPKSLRPEYFEQCWGKLPHVKIVYLDIDQVRAFSSIFKNQMDILVFPYGGFYPMEAFGYYSGQSFNYFLRKGGAIISTGEIPFSKQTNINHSTIGKSDSLNIDRDAYDKWIAKFGIKYYVSPVIPSRSVINSDFLTAVPATTIIKPGRIGIVSNNSSHEPVPKPSNGNVFPERFPTRQVIPLLSGTDQFGRNLTTNALLVQDFQNGSRQILIANDGEPHLLSPSLQRSGIMTDLFRLITNKVIAKDIECSYACYRQGEQVEIKTEIISFEKTPVEIDVRIDILDSSKAIVHSAAEKMQVSGGNEITKKWLWKPASFKSDIYNTRMRIYRNGKLVSEAENGFIVWNDDVVKAGPGISTKNEYFKIGKGESFISGTNYYESTRGEIMWYRPNVSNIAKDIRSMHMSGVNYIRPHYHHTKWFKDYLLYHHLKLFGFYSSLEKLEDPMPDEKGWRIWDMFIYLTQKYGIIYGGDLFTLVPSDMGDPRGWWGTTETIYSKSGRLVQKAFLKQLDKRYASVKGISWDLFNEPFDVPNEDIEAWGRDLKQTLTENNTGRLISIGGSHDISKDIIDYETPHGAPPADLFNMRNMPMLMQELHIDRREGFNDEKDQAEAFRQQYVLVIRNGYSGICPWSWSRQMRLWQDTYEHHYSFPMEKWDDRLGLHTHDDGTIKMAGQVFKDMSILIKKIDFTDFDNQSKKVHSAKGEVKAGISDSLSYIYHINNNLCFAAMNRDSIAWSGKTYLKGPPGSYIYLFSDDNNAIGSSKRLLLKSEKPGKLLLTGMAHKVQKLYLVDASGGKYSIVKELKPVVTKEGLVIEIEDEYTNYWIQVLSK